MLPEPSDLHKTLRVFLITSFHYDTSFILYSPKSQRDTAAMALRLDGEAGKELEDTLKQKLDIGIQILIAPPAALGLAGFAGST